MTTPPATLRTSSALARIRTLALWALGLIVATADAVAFAESYHGLREWAEHHRVPLGFWAAAWPLQVDAYIVAGEIVLLLSAIYGWHRRARALGWAMSITGLVGSIYWNAGHVGKGASTADHITAAVPPIAAMGGLVAALLVIKYLASMDGPVVVDSPSSVFASGGQIMMTPATPAARAAVLSAFVADLTASVAGTTGAVLTLAGETPGSLDVQTSDIETPAVPPTDEVSPRGHEVHEAARRDLKIPVQTSKRPDVQTSNSSLTPEQRANADAYRLLAALPSDAARVRAALGALGSDAIPSQVSAWLSVRGFQIDAAYVKTAIKRARRKADAADDDHEDHGSGVGSLAQVGAGS